MNVFTIGVRTTVLASFVVASTVGRPAIGAELETVVFATPGPASLSTAPYVFTQRLGFFQTEGLKLDFVSLQGSGEIIPQILRGSVLTSMLTPDVIIASRQPGKPNFPMRFAYNVYRRSFWSMSVPVESSIKTWKDFKGKTIGVGALSFANVIQTRAILRQNGIDPADVTLVGVGTGGGALETLRQGRIDAINVTRQTDAVFEGQGMKLRQIAFPPEYGETSSHGLVFSDKIITERPELVKAFGRAYAKGTLACYTNLDGCLDAYWEAYPSARPNPLNDDSRARDRTVLKVIMDSQMYFPNGDADTTMGSYKDLDFTVPENVLREGGEISGPEISPASLYTNEFVTDFNKFDRAEVLRAAKAFKIDGN
jgi:NitT/TauT family transport system substrate-binding protein